MFANLKNKIREETGSDLSQLAPKLTAGVQQRVAAGFRDMRNRGSTSSLSALEEESVGSPEDGTDGMKMAAASLKGRGHDWRHQAETLACEKAVLEDEKAELIRRNLELAEALKDAEAYKKKAIQYQEDLDQLEGFQTQEMAKIKHLLLEREQQLTENTATIAKLQADISRLRGCQEELSNVQAEAAKKEVETREEEKDKEIANLQQRVSTLESDNNALSTRCACIESLESERDSLTERCAVLKSNQRDEAEECRLKESVQSLERECQELRERLSSLQASQEAKDVTAERCKETANALSAERDSLLLRNASLSQQGELACKELQEEISELKSLLDQQKLESGQQLSELRNQLEQMRQSDLTATVADLEEQLADKNKTVRVLQQRLADMKKTLQRELKCPSQNSDLPNASGSAGSNYTMDHNSLLDSAALAVSGKPGNEDINHAYLKHVLIKFLTSREYEAKHLTRAVATLLHFTPEEERLLRETLEWKMSWFGTKPNLGNGQTAKTIPPS